MQRPASVISPSLR